MFLQFFSPTTIPSDQFWFHSVPNDDTLIASPLLTHVAPSSFLACALHALLPSHDSSHRSTALRYDLAVSCFLLTVLRHKICCSDTFSGARFLAMSVRFARSLTPCTFCVTLLTFLRFLVTGLPTHYAVIEMCDCFRTVFTVVSLRCVKYPLDTFVALVVVPHGCIAPTVVSLLQFLFLVLIISPRCVVL